MADQPLDASTRLAVERTRLANERTLMAWIRTSTSLIAFGFTIFKFFQYLATQEHRHTIVSPWIVGMAMILIGLTGLALAWIQHRQQLKALKAEVGDLNKVKRVVKVLGMVNCHSDFIDQPKVINGCSDLLVAVFGDKGKHARSAVGMNSLPSNIAVEIEIIVEVE